MYLILFIPDLILPGTASLVYESHQGPLLNLLHSVQLKNIRDYHVIEDGTVQATQGIPIFMYYLQSLALRQSLNSIRNYPDIRMLPNEIKFGLLKEIEHHSATIDEVIYKIDAGLSLYWNNEFQKDVIQNHAMIPVSCVPRLYNRSIVLDNTNFSVPELIVQKIQGMKIDNLMKVSMDFLSGQFLKYHYKDQIRLANIFHDRYQTLKRVCHTDSAKIERVLHVLFPAKETKNIIMSGLIQSLGLKKDKDMSKCTMAFIAYINILENDIDKVLHKKLPATTNHLSFLIPGMNEVRIISPKNIDISKFEYREKIFPAYPAMRLNKRNIFLSIIGAASESSRLQNSLALKDVQSANRELKTAQSKLDGEYQKILGSRIKENSVLTDIGSHVDSLERSSVKFHEQIGNMTHLNVVSYQHIHSYMSIDLALAMVHTEIMAVQTGLNKDLDTLQNVLSNEGFKIKDTSLLFVGDTLSKVHLTQDSQGLVVDTTIGLDPATWKSLVFKTLPINSSSGVTKLTFDEMIITDGKLKILPEDLPFCNHVTAVCPPEVGVTTLSPCEHYLINQTHGTWTGDNKPVPVKVAEDCAKRIIKTDLPLLSYIHVHQGILVHLYRPTTAYRICATTTNVVNLINGITRLSLAKGCKCMIGETVIKGSTYQYSLKKANYNFIDEKLTNAVEHILQYHPNQQTFNWSNQEQNMTLDSLTDHIHTYVNTLNWTTPQLTYDDSLWNIHPVEAVGHLGPSAILIIILVLTLTIIIVLWCYRHALAKLCRPVFQVTNSPTVFHQPTNTGEFRYMYQPGQPPVSSQSPSDPNFREGSSTTSQVTTTLALQDATRVIENTFQPTITPPSIIEAPHAYYNRTPEQ